MSKADKPDIAPKPKAEVMPATGCVVCGQYTGGLQDVTAHARVHAECAAARPDVVAKVKARA